MSIKSFVVPGVPVPKQSFVYDGCGRGHTDPRVKAWSNLVKFYAIKAVGHSFEPFMGEIAAHLTFVLPDRRRRDCDNLSKNVLDALNGILWKDDNQIHRLTIEKTYGQEPGVFIYVEGVNESS